MFAPFPSVYGASSAPSQPIHSSYTAGPASQQPSIDAGHAVCISLTSNTSADKRTLILRPGVFTIIGRSSRSDFKNLQEAPDNALFDCPVVSRTHAELRTSPWEPPHRQITITDHSSLHGTTVNGVKLAPGRDFVLKSGDVIKLGDRVTRGDDTHDGISLTFARIDTPAVHPLPTPPGRRFQVPSDDDDVSDMDSDDESIDSLREGPSSSANTTPEQHKMKMGSQQQPINIEASPSQPDKVVNLELDEDDLIVMPAASNPLPTIPSRVVPDTYEDDVPEIVAGQRPNHIFLDAEDARSDNGSDEESVHVHNTGLSQILNGRTHVCSSEPDEDSLIDESEDGEIDYQASQDCDFFSDSGASDISNDAVSEAEEEWSTQRQVSPELRNGEPQQGPSCSVPTVSDSVPAAPKPRYDPVRNSQPPEPVRQTVANTASASWLTKPVGWGSLPTVNPSTDMFPNSRWDISPVMAFGENGPDISQLYPPQVFQIPLNGPLDTANYPLMQPTHLSPATNESSASKGIPSQPTLPQLLNATSSPEVPATKSKISITDIVHEPSQVPQTVAGAASRAPPATAAATATSASVPVTTAAAGKRKADETEAHDTPESPEPSTKKSKLTVMENVPAPSLNKLPRKTKRRSLARRVTSSAVHLATGAVMGMGATIVFLNSDKAQQLIDWLA